MDDILERLDPAPSGFGRCGICPYRDTPSVPICYACARKGMTALPEPRCVICDQAISSPTSVCGNKVCTWPYRAFSTAGAFTTRQFEWSRAVAMRDGDLKEAINKYKYEGRKGWGLIFARVLAGFLDLHGELFGQFQLVIPNPTFVGTGPGGRDFDHTLFVLDEAAKLVERHLPFVLNDPIIVKTAATTKLVNLNWSDRREARQNEIRPVLHVPDPDRVRGKSILVYDDVFTDGLLLNTIAGVLREHGAGRVCGVTLARQPWGVS
jgi:predicted amidophosphoribosyltransferase